MRTGVPRSYASVFVAPDLRASTVRGDDALGVDCRRVGTVEHSFDERRSCDAGRLSFWCIEHEALRRLRGVAERELDQRWARNTMLNKWLEYCIDRGHGFRE